MTSGYLANDFATAARCLPDLRHRFIHHAPGG
jgi:hypothetical protein